MHPVQVLSNHPALAIPIDCVSPAVDRPGSSPGLSRDSRGVSVQRLAKDAEPVPVGNLAQFGIPVAADPEGR